MPRCTRWCATTSRRAGSAEPRRQRRARLRPPPAQAFCQPFPNLACFRPRISKHSFGRFMGFQGVTRVPNPKPATPCQIRTVADCKSQVPILSSKRPRPPPRIGGRPDKLKNYCRTNSASPKQNAQKSTPPVSSDVDCFAALKRTNGLVADFLVIFRHGRDEATAVRLIVFL
jgi:hypothetical protein